MKVGAVKAPTIERSQTCKQLRQSVSTSPSRDFRCTALNTWLHRPTLHTFKKVLANSEPSTHGGKADMVYCSANVRLWPKADIPLCIAHVRFWGLTRHGLLRESAFAV